MCSSSRYDNVSAFSGGNTTQINTNFSGDMLHSPISPSLCLPNDVHKFQQEYPRLFNDDDLPAILQSNFQSSPSHTNQQYHTLETQSSFNISIDPQFGSAHIYGSEGDNVDDLWNLYNVDHEQEIHVNEYMVPDGQSYDQGPSQTSDDDRLNAAIAFGTGRETIQQETTAENSTKQINIKKSKSTNTNHFSDGQGFFCLGTEAEFRLTTPPMERQRARYEKELDKAPRYIFVANNRLLTLELSVDPGHLACTYQGYTPYLQIFRTTRPIGPNHSMYLHPYPLWLNDKDNEVIIYNNTLLIPVKSQTIKLDRLIMQRAKQSEIKHLDHLPIYSENVLNFIDTGAINHDRRNKLIETYQLRWSVLHFRICMINREGLIWPTDLHCQTSPIEEFEGPEIESLPEEVRTIMTQSSKRKRILDPQPNKKVKIQDRLPVQKIQDGPISVHVA